MDIFTLLFPGPAPSEPAPTMPLRLIYRHPKMPPDDYTVIDLETSGLDACTSEILDFGLQFIDRKPEMQCFNRNGEAPHVIRACSWQEMENAILQEIEQCKAQGLKSIGLLCKTEKNARQIYDRLKDRTEVSLITQNSDFELQGVCLMPLYLAKGLEFDGVLVCDANRHFYPGKEDKNLLYVACTRALHRLNLFCMGEEIL